MNGSHKLMNGSHKLVNGTANDIMATTHTDGQIIQMDPSSNLNNSLLAHQHQDHYHREISAHELEGDLLKSRVRFETDRNRVQELKLQ